MIFVSYKKVVLFRAFRLFGFLLCLATGQKELGEVRSYARSVVTYLCCPYANSPPHPGGLPSHQDNPLASRGQVPDRPYYKEHIAHISAAARLISGAWLLVPPDVRSNRSSTLLLRRPWCAVGGAIAAAAL